VVVVVVAVAAAAALSLSSLSLKRLGCLRTAVCCCLPLSVEFNVI
jgi:hypothetical protein